MCIGSGGVGSMEHAAKQRAAGPIQVYPRQMLGTGKATLIPSERSLDLVVALQCILLVRT